MPDITTAPVPDTAPATPASPVCDVDGCGLPATHAYVWAWGTAGHCCARHVAVLRQRAGNLGRDVHITALAAAAPLPMTRDERVRLHAEALAANEEVAETKGRNRELYNANQELGHELGRVRTELRELQSQIADLHSELDSGITERANLKRELAEKTNELVRLQGVLHAHETTP